MVLKLACVCASIGIVLNFFPSHQMLATEESLGNYCHHLWSNLPLWATMISKGLSFISNRQRRKECTFCASELAGIEPTLLAPDKQGMPAFANQARGGGIEIQITPNSSTQIDTIHFIPNLQVQAFNAGLHLRKMRLDLDWAFHFNKIMQLKE